MTDEQVPAVDPAAVMAEIRGRIERRKAAGEYSEDELRAIADMELRLEEREGYGEESDRIISWLHANWEATGPVDLEGQAPAPPLKRLAKKLLRTLLSPIARVLLAKQNQVNARLVQLLSGSIPTLRDGLGDVETRGDQRFAALEKEVRRLAGEVERLEKRLDGGTGREREGP